MGDPIRLEQEEAEQIEKALHSFYGICVTAHQEHLCTTALSLLAAARQSDGQVELADKPASDAAVDRQTGAREPAKDTARPVIGPWGVTLPEPEAKLLWHAIDAHTQAKTWDDRTSAACVIDCRMKDLVRAALQAQGQGGATK